MIDRAELKAAAKEQIRGKLVMLFVVTLIYSAVLAGVKLIPFVGGLIASVATPILSFGVVVVYLSVSHGKDVEIGDLFKGFYNFVPVWVLNFLMGIFIFLWSLLFVIPGIIKTLSYSMSLYILAENPELTAMQALNRSKVMMNGHKMELFMLGLSFILWGLLCVVTCGIAMIYVAPYISTTQANFYNAIKNDVAYTSVED